MKYVLVNKQDEIEWSQDLASNVGISGAKTYFRGIKQIDEESFDELWKVMTKSEYDRLYEANLRPQSSKHIRWWEDIGEGSDLDEC